MNTNFNLEAQNGSILIDGKETTEERFISLIKQGLNHNICFQSGYNMRFCIDKSFGKWMVQFPAAAPNQLEFFFQEVLRLLEENGSAILTQDTFWAERKKCRL